MYQVYNCPYCNIRIKKWYPPFWDTSREVSWSDDCFKLIKKEKNYCICPSCSKMVERPKLEWNDADDCYEKVSKGEIYMEFEDAPEILEEITPKKNDYLEAFNSTSCSKDLKIYSAAQVLRMANDRIREEIKYFEENTFFLDLDDNDLEGYLQKMENYFSRCQQNLKENSNLPRGVFEEQMIDGFLDAIQKELSLSLEDKEIEMIKKSIVDGLELDNREIDDPNVLASFVAANGVDFPDVPEEIARFYYIGIPQNEVRKNIESKKSFLIEALKKIKSFEYDEKEIRCFLYLENFLCEQRNPMLAELLREKGDFEQALLVLDDFLTVDDKIRLDEEYGSLLFNCLFPIERIRFACKEKSRYIFNFYKNDDKDTDFHVIKSEVLIF